MTISSYHTCKLSGKRTGIDYLRKYKITSFFVIPTVVEESLNKYFFILLQPKVPKAFKGKKLVGWQ